MKRDYYVTPRSSAIMRFLWRAAGADRYLLERATYSDQIKYMCLGGIVLATGVMAGIAGGYAFYTIFSPRGTALESDLAIGVAIESVIFGIIWGLMIFNIDRFIVTSTGKGDGTEEITWEEFKGAIPRIIMGSIIALTISKPVEIRMFKTEIDAKLHEKQLEAEMKYKTQVDTIYSDKEKLNNKDLAKVEEERSKMKDLLNSTASKFNEVADKTVTRTGSRLDANGNTIYYKYEVPHPSIKIYQDQMDKLQQEINEFDIKNADKLKQIEDERKKLRKEKEEALGKNKQVAASLDGLLERILLAHEVAGFWISLFITLLFMAIELTPVFFKLMLVKTPYDYLEENIKELMQAEEGIYVQHNYYKDKQGLERDLVTFINVEKQIHERLAMLNTQKELTAYALEKYTEKVKKDIDENPEAYVKILTPPGKPTS